MWSILIGVILFFFIGVIISYIMFIEDRDSVILIIPIILSISLIGVLAGTLFGIFIDSDFKENISKFNIESLQDNNSINSGFVLGSGYIDGSLNYTFYQNIGDNTYKLTELDADIVVIKYINPKEKPYGEIHTFEKSKAIINSFSLDLNRPSKHYVLHVPKGSIKQNYVLDAQ